MSPGKQSGKRIAQSPNIVLSDTSTSQDDHQDSLVTIANSNPVARSPMLTKDEKSVETSMLDTGLPSNNIIQTPVDESQCFENGNETIQASKVDYSAIMFLSTGGALVANQAQIEAAKKDSVQEPSGGTCSWRDYNPFAQRLFWTALLTPFTVVYLSIALVLYFANDQGWAHRDVVTVSLTAVAGSLTVLVTLWTGSMMFRFRKHPVVIGRGLIFISQLHVGVLCFVPAMCYTTYTNGKAEERNLVIESWMTVASFIYLSAVVARLRQIVQLFCQTTYQSAPKRTYRNTVLFIGVLYLIGTIGRIGVVISVSDSRLTYLPITVVDVICLLLLCYYGYKSRHASAQFSDYNQLARLVFCYWVVILITLFWNIVNGSAYIVRHILIMGMMALNLVDSYYSLYHFIRYKLDPKSMREVLFSPPGSDELPVRIVTTVADIRPTNQQRTPTESVEESPATTATHTEHPPPMAMRSSTYI